ncbi:putative membrane protein [Escherichia coli 2-005-03_S3_C3]|nr:putative membrane protein [Escherichia coli 2-005-03_S3_C3]
MCVMLVFSVFVTVRFLIDVFVLKTSYLVNVIARFIAIFLAT